MYGWKLLCEQHYLYSIFRIWIKTTYIDMESWDYNLHISLLRDVKKYVQLSFLRVRKLAQM